jgi:hypothetical protein
MWLINDTTCNAGGQRGNAYTQGRSVGDTELNAMTQLLADERNCSKNAWTIP